MPELDTRTFQAFRDLVYARSGIQLSEGKQSLVSARLGKRVRALGLDDFRDYLHHVESEGDGEELVQLLDAISTNVTHFFRESSHFDVLRKLVDHWLNQGQRRFRFWSAASSTGEEPYTLAMVLHQCFEGQGDIDWKILATDISTQVLKFADTATYPASRVRDIPPFLLDRYFDKNGRQESAVFQVKPELRRRVTFKRLNLSQPPFPLSGPLDLVMCRNVMIYFDNAVRSRLLNEFHRLLKHHGYLFVGHSESLTGMLSSFENKGPSVYRKEKA